MLKKLQIQQNLRMKAPGDMATITPSVPTKVSVIIPARNEERCLEDTLRSLQNIRKHEYPNLEIIVGVGPSKDGTHEIACVYADRVVNVGEGPSRARNEAGWCASGEILVFLDADAVPLAGAIREIVKAMERGGHAVGTCAMCPDVSNWKSLALARLKNTIRKWLHRGCSELIFCDRSLFIDEGVQFDVEMRMGELSDFFKRAMQGAKARYEYLHNVKYQFSVRRYEEVGYERVMLQWIGWTLVRRFKKVRQKLEGKYWSIEYRAGQPRKPSTPM